MAEKTVFISSTYLDLKEYRRGVWDALKRFDVAVRGMEEFGARSAGPLETCLAEVEESDVYVGIVAYRLGSIDPESKRPFTVLEYEKALEQKKEILIYLADDDAASFPQSAVDKDSGLRKRLAAFKEKLREHHTIDTFSTPQDLADKLSRDFKKRFVPRQQELEPQDNEDEFAKSAQTLKEFLLTPKRYNAYSVRLSVNFHGEVFPASRELCERFNLEYGFTLGAYMHIAKPTGRNGAFGFREMYAVGNNIDAFRAMVETKHADVYAQLRFAEQDVKSVRGVFLGYTTYAYDDPDPGDPNEIYVSAEGKVILLFVKNA